MSVFVAVPLVSLVRHQAASSSIGSVHLLPYTVYKTSYTILGLLYVSGSIHVGTHYIGLYFLVGAS
jgi:hypothetical protein